MTSALDLGQCVVATTMAAFVMDDPDTWASWLLHAEDMLDAHPDTRFFAALEVDARGTAPFGALLERFAEIDAYAEAKPGVEQPVTDHWTYTLDDGRTAVTTANRLRHIVAGQNLCTDYALSSPASHMLFLAADLEPPADAVPKLAELRWPIVGGHVPTYCLDGPKAPGGYPAEWDVRSHMATAAFVMLARPLLRVLRWRWDRDTGMSDDPCLHHDALAYHGFPTYVRHDCVGRHHPETIGAVEHRGHDMTVVRSDQGSDG